MIKNNAVTISVGALGISWVIGPGLGDASSEVGPLSYWAPHDTGVQLIHSQDIREIIQSYQYQIDVHITKLPEMVESAAGDADKLAKDMRWWAGEHYRLERALEHWRGVAARASNTSARSR